MIQEVNKSGVLMQEVRDIANYFFEMQELGQFYDEDDAFFQEEDYAKEIVYAVHCWLTKRYGTLDDEMMKAFVGIMVGRRL